MGLYLNPNNEQFYADTSSDIYVDKTGLIKELNKVLCKSDRCVAVSHARRFGKTQAANLIEAYYSVGCNSRDIFSKYEIAQSDDFEEHLNKYNVIHIDVSSFSDYSGADVVESIIQALIDDFQDLFPDIEYDVPLHRIIYKIYQRTKNRFVIIVDEWDCIIRNYADQPKLVHRYMQFLHSLFKSMEAGRFLALGYVTGILPIKKINDESALNNFRERTMMDSKNIARYYGFTEEEVKVLCDEYDMPFDEIKSWYNGYLINGLHMYNPNSVCQAMMNHDLCSYWTNTSAFSSINQYITLGFDGLRDAIIKILAGEEVVVNTATFRNDLSNINSRDEALTALIHLGYLGFKKQGDNRGIAYVPNYEVKQAFWQALSTGPWKEIAKSVQKCDDLLDATLKADEEQVAQLLELSHEAYVSINKYNDENSLSCAITMAYFTASAYYTVIRELPSGKGFADLAFIPLPGNSSKPAMIVELKYDKSAETAIDQIKDKRYTDALAGYTGDILLVGINYDPKSKKHTCKIEHWHPGKQIPNNNKTIDNPSFGSKMLDYFDTIKPSNQGNDTE